MVKLRRVYESDLYLESKKDLDDLRDYLGDKLFDDYMKIRDRIPKDQNEFKDFSKLKKMDKKDIQDFIDNFKSKSDKKKSDKTEGAEKLYEDGDWVVYKITTYPAAQLYGKNTKWCITGRYHGHEERGEEYFYDYINDKNLDGGYYFYINKKDPSDKYCVLQTKDKKIDSVWDAEDTDRGSSTTALVRDGILLPNIPEVNLEEDLKLVFNTYLKEGNLDKIEHFLKEGFIDVNGAYDEDNIQGGTYLYNIAKSTYLNKYLEIIELLLKYGADPTIDNGFGSPIVDAVRSYNSDLVNLYIKYGLDVNGKYLPKDSLLTLACKKDDIDTAKVLLENGADPDFTITEGTYTFPLLQALKNDNIDLISLLIENGADINKEDKIHRSLIDNAFLMGCNLDFIKYLINNGAEINRKGREPSLIQAVKGRNLEVVKFLVENMNCDVNAKNKGGETALDWANIIHESEIEEYLLKHVAK